MLEAAVVVIEVVVVVVQPLPLYKGHHPALEVDIVESFDLF